MSKKNFCTCEDTDCNLNPANHDYGCDPCIQKNLRAGEIPTCFFKAVSEDISEIKTFSSEEFADFVSRNKKTE